MKIQFRARAGVGQITGHPCRVFPPPTSHPRGYRR